MSRLMFLYKLGVDPKKSDQQVRGTVSLPHGNWKEDDCRGSS